MSEHIQAAIIEMLNSKNTYLTFTELAKIDGFTGELEMINPELNIVLWTDMSQEALEAIISLVEAEIITFENTSHHEYEDNGYIPRYPIANSRRKYKHTRWAPVAMHKGSQFFTSYI